MATRRVQLVSTKSERKSVIQWMLTKVEENGSDSTIPAQAVEQSPSIFSLISRRAKKEKARRSRKTRNNFFLLSKLCRINYCRLVVVVNEDALFVEDKLRHFMGEVASVIGGRMFFMKF